MEVDQADAAEPRIDAHVGRIAGEPRARDAILHDVEGLHHHGGEARAGRGAEELTLERSSRPEHRAQTALLRARSRNTSSSLSSEPWLGDGRAAADQVGVEVDGDDHARAERAAAETGTGLTSAPSISQRPPTRTGANTPGSE